MKSVKFLVCMFLALSLVACGTALDPVQTPESLSPPPTETVRAVEPVPDETLPAPETEESSIWGPSDYEYNGPDSRSDWYRWQIDKVFRDAEEVLFDQPGLTYVSNLSPDEATLKYSLTLAYPQLKEDDAFSVAFNNYYKSKFEQVTEADKQRIADSANDTGDGFHEHYIENTFDCAYTWGRFLTVVIEDRCFFGRGFSDPMVDNFDLVTGKRLAFSDVFNVNRAAYIWELANRTLHPFIPANKEREEQYTTGIPLPQNGDFLITPNGIAFQYALSSLLNG